MAKTTTNMLTSLRRRFFPKGAAILVGIALTTSPLHAGEVAAPIVVELFTSQGCSSCPPADKILGQLAKRDDVVALSLPVDYWDYLGWKDTLASPAYTARQREYARKHQSGGVYTPQVIVNGLIGVVGSNRNAIEYAIEKTRRELKGAAVPVEMTDSNGKLHLKIGAAPEGSKFRRGTVWIVPLVSARSVSIGRGENRGRQITYHNVARKLIRVGEWRGETMSLTLSQDKVMPPGADACAVILQGDRSGAILGAAKMSGI